MSETSRYPRSGPGMSTCRQEWLHIAHAVTDTPSTWVEIWERSGKPRQSVILGLRYARAHNLVQESTEVYKKYRRRSLYRTLA